MNINYINESVISVAVMRRKHTRMHGANRESTVCVCVCVCGGCLLWFYKAKLSPSLGDWHTICE